MNATNTFSALIIDDERNARENLAMLLDEYCPEIEVVGLADGVNSAREKIEALKPDVLFLDIRMPSGAEGFDLLNQMSDHPFVVIFVTAFRDYAIEAFNTNAVHYILKPVDIEELKSAVGKVAQQAKRMRKSPNDFEQYKQQLENMMQQFSRTKERIAIHHAKGIKLVWPKDIQFVQADGNCTRLHLSDGSTYLDTRTLKVYEDSLPEQLFLRVHRSYIVNLHEVEELIRSKGNWLLMKNRQKVPVSRGRLSTFLKSI